MAFKFHKLILVFLLMAGVEAFGQEEWTYAVSGKVYEGNQPLEGAVVTLVGGRGAATIVTSKKGKFDFVLFGGFDYVLAVSKPGYITRKTEIDTRDVPPGKYQDGLGTFIIEKIKIFKMPPNTTQNQLDSCKGKPYLRIRYNKQNKNLEVDKDYQEQVKPCVEYMEKIEKEVEERNMMIRDSIDKTLKKENSGDPDDKSGPK